jgi:hypothetical protein
MAVPQRNALLALVGSCRAAVHSVVRSSRRRFPRRIAGTGSAPRALLTLRGSTTGPQGSPLVAKRGVSRATSIHRRRMRMRRSCRSYAAAGCRL